MSDDKGEVLSTKKVYAGSVLNLRVDRTLLPNGMEVNREIIEHTGAVAIVALDADDNILLARQYRPAIDRDLLEIPAGGLKVGESPEDCARRELQEEIGMYPKKLDYLGRVYPVPGYGEEVLHMFLARDLHPAQLDGDPDEDIAVERMSLDDLVARIDRSEIADMKTIAGALWVTRFLAREQKR